MNKLVLLILAVLTLAFTSPAYAVTDNFGNEIGLVEDVGSESISDTETLPGDVMTPQAVAETKEEIRMITTEEMKTLAIPFFFIITFTFIGFWAFWEWTIGMITSYRRALRERRKEESEKH
jgi:hypothetical protein